MSLVCTWIWRQRSPRSCTCGVQSNEVFSSSPSLPPLSAENSNSYLLPAERGSCLLAFGRKCNAQFPWGGTGLKNSKAFPFWDTGIISPCYSLPYSLSIYKSSCDPCIHGARWKLMLRSCGLLKPPHSGLCLFQVPWISDASEVISFILP